MSVGGTFQCSLDSSDQDDLLSLVAVADLQNAYSHSDKLRLRYKVYKLRRRKLTELTILYCIHSNSISIWQFSFETILSNRPSFSTQRQESRLILMVSYYDEIEIEDFTWDEIAKVYHTPCPCGDRFEISKSQLAKGEDVATCPSCSLIVRVIYDMLDFEDYESDEDGVSESSTINEKSIILTDSMTQLTL
ncbi:hypothetical protein O181_036249 [Austropuccinia psidii MF-1]|uniref:Diphthamide biosynthesis protein 3 n=1 Tax=Austropuccinia psidii MF-1 TaxID=1389203 RepID=A0A9Q3D473_9BASI|nr:hypothetical protein [Austropuccinia psidii MF-1]